MEGFRDSPSHFWNKCLAVNQIKWSLLCRKTSFFLVLTQPFIIITSQNKRPKFRMTTYYITFFSLNLLKILVRGLSINYVKMEFMVGWGLPNVLRFINWFRSIYYNTWVYEIILSGVGNSTMVPQKGRVVQKQTT